RPLQYGDMVVLVRRAKTAVDLARVLRRQGIPVMIVGRESILDSAEVRDLVAILRLLGNQRLDLEMAIETKLSESFLVRANCRRLNSYSPVGVTLLSWLKSSVSGSQFNRLKDIPLLRRLMVGTPRHASL
ncbi:MAG: 3'-5' exonuclease, partial [Pseudomonadota bacterium]